MNIPKVALIHLKRADTTGREKKESSSRLGVGLRFGEADMESRRENFTAHRPKCMETIVWAGAKFETTFAT